MDDKMDRIRGVIFGTAIGDALGYPVEFEPVTADRPAVFPDSVPVRYSDDTQMMRAVFEGLWRARTWTDIDAAAAEIGAEFVAWAKSPENNRAPGAACMYGCSRLGAGVPWREAGRAESGGCGTAMRSMAFGVWFSADIEKAGRWAAELAKMTHGHPMAAAAAAAVAVGVGLAMVGTSPVIVAAGMAKAAFPYDGNTANMILDAADAYREYLGDPQVERVVRVLDRWRGWAGHEAVAASLFCWLIHQDDFENAVLTAANSPGDSDSLAAITGALCGARVGAGGIPDRWLAQVEKADELEALAHRVAQLCV